MDSKFFDLVTPYYYLIHKVVHEYIKDYDDQEDCKQLILIAIWESYPSFRGNSKFSTWLYRIALNKTIDFLRKKRTVASWDNVAAHLFNDTSKPETPYERVLPTAMQRLNDIERILIDLFYRRDFSVIAISDFTGLSEIAVRLRIHRARLRLKTHINSLLYENY